MIVPKFKQTNLRNFREPTALYSPLFLAKNLSLYKS
jgi:hypothetical protein